MPIFKKNTKTKKVTPSKPKTTATKFSSISFSCQPHLTEKSTAQRESGKYTFLVGINTNKIEIKRFIEKFYNVKVSDVNISKKFFSPTNFRNEISKKSPVKKAIVTLVKGQKIEFNV